MKDPKAYIDFDTGFNRYIVECKLESSFDGGIKMAVLIDT